MIHVYTHNKDNYCVYTCIYIACRYTHDLACVSRTWVRRIFYPASSCKLAGSNALEPHWLLVDQTCLTWQACTSLPGQRFVELNWFTLVQIMSRQACANLTGRRFVEPTWSKLVTHKTWPGKIVQARRVKVFVETDWFTFVQNNDQTGLCKLAG